MEESRLNPAVESGDVRSPTFTTPSRSRSVGASCYAVRIGATLGTGTQTSCTSSNRVFFGGGDTPPDSSTSSETWPDVVSHGIPTVCPTFPFCPSTRSPPGHSPADTGGNYGRVTPSTGVSGQNRDGSRVSSSTTAPVSSPPRSVPT